MKLNIFTSESREVVEGTTNFVAHKYLPEVYGSFSDPATSVEVEHMSYPLHTQCKRVNGETICAKFVLADPDLNDMYVNLVAERDALQAKLDKQKPNKNLAKIHKAYKKLSKEHKEMVESHQALLFNFDSMKRKCDDQERKLRCGDGVPSGVDHEHVSSGRYQSLGDMYGGWTTAGDLHINSEVFHQACVCTPHEVPEVSLRSLRDAMQTIGGLSGTIHNDSGS